MIESPEARELGKILQEARKKIGLSVEDASRRSRIHFNIISDMENGVFNRLNKLYTKSFLKKYTSFLELNEDEILKKYESVATGAPESEFSPEIKEKEEEPEFPAVSEKTIQMALAGVLSVVFIILLFVFVGKVRNKISSGRQAEPAKTAARKRTAQAPAREPVVPAPKKTASAPAKKPESAPVQKRTTAARRSDSTVDLTLRAQGEVWVKVMQGNNTLFVGILRKGHQKSWQTDGAITLWTGRADMLEFTVNGQDVGKIAEGVVKDIKISNEGVTIKGAWVTRF